MVHSRIVSAVDRLPLPSWFKYFFFGVRDAEFIEFLCDCELAARLPHRTARIREESPSLTDEEISSRIDFWLAADSNLSSDFTIGVLAKKIGVSKSRLSQYFSKNVPEDFRTWKCAVRIKRAREILLEDSLASIGKIGEYLGFGDRTNFHRQFLKHTGLTPLQWRKENEALSN